MRWRLGVIAGMLACGPASERTDPDATAQTQRQVSLAIERYQVAARAVNPDSIAAFYTPTAMLFEPGINPIVGRDSIRAFVASFPGVRVDSATATADTIEVFDGTAYVWGSYFEKLAFPGQPVSEQHGKFVMQWVRQPRGEWLMQRYFRVPAPSPSPSADRAR